MLIVEASIVNATSYVQIAKENKRISLIQLVYREVWVLPTVSATMLAVVGTLCWFYVTFRIKSPVERHWTEFGQIFTFFFFCAGLVGVLVAVSILVGPIQ